MEFRVVIRRCFITFAVAFRDNDWVHTGKGVAGAVVLKIFAAVSNGKPDTAQGILAALETMNLLERARHGTTSRALSCNERDSSESDRAMSLTTKVETGPTKSTFLEVPVVCNARFAACNWRRIREA
jgi:hypothetical protein